MDHRRCICNPAIPHRKVYALIAIRAAGDRSRITAENGGDPEGIPSAIRPIGNAACLNAIGCCHGRKRMRHPDGVLRIVQRDRAGARKGDISPFHVCRIASEGVRHFGRSWSRPVLDEVTVDFEANRLFK